MPGGRGMRLPGWRHTAGVSTVRSTRLDHLGGLGDVGGGRDALGLIARWWFRRHGAGRRALVEPEVAVAAALGHALGAQDAEGVDGGR